MHRIMHAVVIMSALSLGAAASAQAAIARVFVSVNGNDANPCENIATPCRTFAAGIARVDADGEVIVLDTGSYGGTTITKAVRINVPTGVVAFAAQPFVVNVPGGVVVLRGLTLKALTPGTGTGITYTAAAALHVENCVLDGWSTGLEVDSTGAFFVNDSTFRNMSTAGIIANPPSGALDGTIENSRFENSFYGILVGGGRIDMRNSVASSNNIGAGAQGGTPSVAELNVDKCLFANNSTDGVFASASLAVARVSNSIVTDNANGLHNYGSGAVVKSWGNNAMDGNGANTTGTVTMVTLQ